MQTKFILPCLLSTLFFLNSFSPSAQNRKTIETTTDILMFITPVAGFAGSLAIGDYQGTKQIIFSGAMNMAMTYALKYVIRKERPDHSDHHAFPSSHTSVSFQGASFIQRRYGWKFGLPAYLLSAYVGWGRTYAKKHDWWDIIGGAAIGTAVGAGTGAVIGKKMDKKAAELEALENAKVETVQDQNGLQAIKVTFNSGILFPTNGSTLSQTSKNELSQFATKMSDMQDTDITIYGHTDNTGPDAVNERLSNERAQSVANYLKNCGIASSRMTTEGKSYSMPVADNSTKEGRAQNRRVEIYITANKTMIEKAENGTL